MQASLRTFGKSELIFNADETKAILEFFFPRHKIIVSQLPVTDELRGFAQGLLVEAVDSSFAIGFVASLFKAAANPRSGGVSFLRKLGTGAAKHRFLAQLPRASHETAWT